VESDLRAHGNSSMLPRLPRPTQIRVRAHQEKIDVAGRSRAQLSPIANVRASGHKDSDGKAFPKISADRPAERESCVPRITHRNGRRTGYLDEIAPPLRRIVSLTAQIDKLVRERELAIARAVAGGETWAEIGKSLRCSPQAAHAKCRWLHHNDKTGEVWRERPLPR